MHTNLILATLLLMITLCNTAWSAPIAIYVAEFRVSGANSPDEMKTTIQALLLSRLASEHITTQDMAGGAEITVSGSYLLSGNVFSLDAVAVNSERVVIARAFTQGKNPDELIPAVGVLAKTLSGEIAKGAVQASQRSAKVLPDIIKAKPLMTVSGQAIHKMTGALSGLAVGRTMPDGTRELFVAGNQILRYYRQGAELKLMAEIPYKVYERVLAVDSADLDNNGNPEVYVTVMNGEVLTSQVWVVDDTRLKQIAGPLPYFFRAISSAGGTKKLYAQQISGNADFSGDVAEVVKTGNNYVLKNPIKLPKNGYLYNFSILKGSKGELNPIITDRSGYLRVFTAAGDELEKSSEEYGGSETSFKRADHGSSDGYRHVYLDQRMVIKGTNEFLVAKNSSSWFMKNKHSYSKSSLYGFTWNGSDLEEKWHTKQSDYYLADFAYDENSRELLLLEVVAKEEGLFDKGASRLVIRKVD